MSPAFETADEFPDFSTDIKKQSDTLSANQGVRADGAAMSNGDLYGHAVAEQRAVPAAFDSLTFNSQADFIAIQGPMFYAEIEGTDTAARLRFGWAPTSAVANNAVMLHCIRDLLTGTVEVFLETLAGEAPSAEGDVTAFQTAFLGD